MIKQPIGNTPQDVLRRNLFFVKDAVKRSEAKTSDKFDVYDPETKEIILECREPEIGALTKLGRFFGGTHDEGSPFNLVAKIPANGQQVFRVSRKSATFSLEGPPTEFHDQSDAPVASLKKKALAFGLKFRFFDKLKQELFLLEIKSTRSQVELRVDGKEVGRIGGNIPGEHAAYLQSIGPAYALTLSPDLPETSQMRLLLLATVIAGRRINLATTILIPVAG